MLTVAIPLYHSSGMLARLKSWLGALVGGAVEAGAVHGELAPVAAELRRMASVLDALDEHGQAAEARLLADAITDPATRVVLCGEFSVGKSTLVNALLGELLLRFAMLPTTAVPIEIRHGAARTQAARFADGREEAISPEAFARDEALDLASRARAGLARLCVTSPNPLLQHLALIDTPGLLDAGAQSSKALSEATNADVVVLVVSARKPWSATERQLATDMLVKRLGKPVLVVLNGLNLVAARDRSELRQYLAAAVRPLGSTLPPQLKRPVLEVDALPALRWSALREGSRPKDDFSALLRSLRALRGRGGEAVVRASRLRRIGDLVRTLAAANDAAIAGIRARLEARRTAGEQAEAGARRRLAQLDVRAAVERAALQEEAARFKPGGPRFPNDVLARRDPAQRYRSRLEAALRQGAAGIAMAADARFARLAPLAGNAVEAPFLSASAGSYQLSDDISPPSEGVLRRAWRAVTRAPSEHEQADARHRAELMAQCQAVLDAEEARVLRAFDAAVARVRGAVERELEAVRRDGAPQAQPLSEELARRLELAEMLERLGQRYPAYTPAASPEPQENGKTAP